LIEQEQRRADDRCVLLLLGGGTSRELVVLYFHEKWQGGFVPVRADESPRAADPAPRTPFVSAAIRAKSV
jgi:hypothetical protein